MNFRHPNEGRFTRQDVTPAYDGYAVASSAFWEEGASVTALAGSAQISLSATGVLAPRFSYAKISLSATGVLTQTPLTGAAVLSLSATASGDIGRGLILEPPAIGRQSIFRVYLTAPGYEDLELPCRSFQARNRLTTRNYLAVVVPDPLPYIAAIQERGDGRLVIKSGFLQADNTEVLSPLISAVFETFRYDIGPFNGSATLVGYDYRAPGAPLTRTMRGISFLGMTNSGARRVRCDLDMYLKPGDTADLGDDESIVVDQISYTVSARQAVMEISEAEPSG
jgi:hypothetical protein